MQNRKSFLKTAVVGVAGAIGLTLIPSKVLAESIPTRGLKAVYHRQLKYRLTIGRMIEIKNDPIRHFRLHPVTFISEEQFPMMRLSREISDELTKELGTTVGRIEPHPFCDSGYGYLFTFEPHPIGAPTTMGNVINTTKINKTMQHIIDGTPDPFMEYPYANEI
jgi:hypothetical protein